MKPPIPRPAEPHDSAKAGDTGSTLLCTHDLEGKILSANAAAARVLEVEMSSLLGRNLRDLLPVRLRGAFDSYLAKIVTDGFAEGQMKVVTGSGRERVWRYNNRVGRHSVEGTVVYGWAFDVSEMRSAMNAARTTRSHLETILKHVPIFLLAFDHDGRIELCEGLALEELGLGPGRIVGESVFQRFGEVKFFLKDGRVFEGDEIFRRVLRSEIVTASARLSHSYFRFHLFPEPRPEGAPAGAVGVGVDVTETRRAVEAIQQSEEKYRQIFARAPVGIYQSNREGRLLTANETLARILGYSRPEELIHLSMGADVYLDSTQRDELISKYAARELSTEFEVQWKKRNGTPIWVSLTSHAVKDEAGRPNYFEGFVVDITERKEAERELQSSREQLRNLASRLQAVREEERTMVAREIHDELGQQLTAMKMDLAWIERKLPIAKTEEDQRLLQDKLSSASKLMMEAIDAVRRIASRLRPGVLDDLGLLPAIAWQADEFSKRAGISCAVHAETGDFALDPERSTAIFRVLQEALTNVIRHSGAKAVTVELAKVGGEVEMTVADDGRGIRNEEITDRRSVGVLGMKERIVGLGGSFDIEGLPEEGTKVRVRFPSPPESRKADRP